tara:strand:- start:773 stop:1618 length:846 start_codon:yes stop_codon:yes gene_type:complete
MKNNNLNDIENYSKDLECNEYILFIKYVGLIHELIECSINKININKSSYYKEILIKGIKNINYIYNLVLLYTNNLDITLYTTQKSILYFIEFISQIDDENHSFLNLTINDASMFIYKKTIFEINDEFKKSYNQCDNNKHTMTMLQLYIELYNKILFKIIEKYDFNIDVSNSNKLMKFQNITYNNFYKIVECLMDIQDIFKNNTDDIKNKLNEYSIFIDNINDFYDKEYINNNYFNIIAYTIKKGYKNNINNENIIKQLNNDDNTIILKNYSVCKLFNYLNN